MAYRDTCMFSNFLFHSLGQPDSADGEFNGDCNCFVAERVGLEVTNMGNDGHIVSEELGKQTTYI